MFLDECAFAFDADDGVVVDDQQIDLQRLAVAFGRDIGV